jgi:hypothetical protein
MTRTELLQLLIGQARESGFEFRRWYVAHTAMPWTGADEAVRWLARGKRAHMLVFSHGFARHFFRSGERITFVVPQQTFQSARPGGGEARTVQRRAHLRRSSRENVWRFHLREMADAAEPLRYLRRYLLTEESMMADDNSEEEDPIPAATPSNRNPKKSARSTSQEPTEEEEAMNYDDEHMVRDGDKTP